MDFSELLSDPPQVHAGGAAIWKAEDDLYALIADHCQSGSRTLETGLGLSTALFAQQGCEHTCVVVSQQEVELFRTYLERHGIDDSGIRFEVGPSDQVLPRLDPTELDVVLIDGRHGWPTPIVDWYYAASRLRPGGLLVLDDTWLEAVSLGLVDFLDRDDRWALVVRRMRWAAYRKLDAHDLGEEHVDQPFLGRSVAARIARRLPPPALHVAARIARNRSLL